MEAGILMRQYLLLLITVVLLAGCGWLFTSLFEQYEEEIDTGYSEKARYNPYLAAKYFLEDNDVEVHTQTSDLDFSSISHDDMVFLSSIDSMLLTESQINQALEWIAQGGFLIVGVEKEIDGYDSFLNRFDVEPTQYGFDDGGFFDLFNDLEEEATEQLEDINDQIKQEQGDDNWEEETEAEEIYRVSLSSVEEDISLEVLDWIVLNHPEANDYELDDDFWDTDDEARPEAPLAYELTAVVGDDEGPRLLQFSYGEGTFTAMSSTYLWQNEDIGAEDHAFFLSYLVPEQSVIHFFYNISMPSLLSLFKRYFFELLITSVTLLLFWLWRISLRVQGIRHSVSGARRIFSEHLRASAEFLVARKQYKSLLTPINEDITAQMIPLHPGFVLLDPEAKVNLIAKRVGMTEEAIQMWLGYIEHVRNQDELIAALKLGSAIRRKL